MDKNLFMKFSQLNALKNERENRINKICNDSNVYEYTAHPTNTPSSQPNNNNIVHPSFNPTVKPSFIPTSNTSTSIAPTPAAISSTISPTVVCYTTSSQSYNKIECNSSLLLGTNENDEFDLNCKGEVKVYGKGGSNKYNVLIVQDASFICADFQPKCDLIDLSAFDKIHQFTDLKISGYPATIHLPNKQKFVINGLLPSNLQEENFVFNQFIGDDHHGDDVNNPNNFFYKQGWFIAVSSVVGFLVSVCTIGVIAVKCVGYLNPTESSVQKVIPVVHPDDVIVKETPIGIALSINNIELIKHEVSKVEFDYYDNDHLVKTSWVGPNDVLLVYDHNDNGLVDFAKEIVLTEWCVDAKTDFEALLCNFDFNKDKIFNKEDQEFSKFYLWQDKNQDGISQNFELTSLREAGVLAIDFNTQEEIEGELRELGALNKAEVLWANGSITYAYDLVFVHDVV